MCLICFRGNTHLQKEWQHSPPQRLGEVKPQHVEQQAIRQQRVRRQALARDGRGVVPLQVAVHRGEEENETQQTW